MIRDTELSRSQVKLTLGKLLLVSALIFSCFYVFQDSSLAEYLETRFSLPTLVNLRHAMGRGPKIDPRLKILSFDDSTLGKLGRTDLTLAEWTSLLKAIDQRRPRAIYVDKLFSLPPVAGPDREENLRILRSLETPIITTAFVTQKKIHFRSLLDMDRPWYKILSLFDSKLSILREGIVPMQDVEGWHAYGPHHDLAAAFPRAGHALNAGFGRATVLLKTGPQTVLPHVVFMGPFELRVRGGELLSNGKVVPLDRHGRVLVDFPQLDSYLGRNQRLLHTLERVRSGEPLTGIGPDDVVLILPAMFTGGTDFTVTPVGPMPGGFVIAALLNSLVRGEWLKPSLYGTLSILIATMAGTLVILLTGKWLAIAIVGVLGAWFVAATLLFAFSGVLVELTPPAFAFVVTAMSMMVIRNQLREKLVLFLKVLKTENEALRNEIIQAGEIAKVFNPESAPSWEELEVSVFHRSLLSASGDWFAFESGRSGRFRHFVMCDITGHGVQAAIVVSACRTVLSLLVERHPENLDSPDFLQEYMRILNSTLYKQGRGYHITTLLGLTYDNKTKELTYLSAGHPPPLHISPTMEEDRLKLGVLLSQNNPLGVREECHPAIGRVRVMPGDAVIAFTDGVPFPRNPRAVHSLLKDCLSHPAEVAAARLTSELWRAYSGRTGKKLEDDLSLVIFRFQRRARQRFDKAS